MTATTAILLPRRPGPAAPRCSLALVLVLVASAALGCGSPDDAPRATPEMSGPAEPPPPPRPSPGVDLDGPIPLPERGGPIARGGSRVPVELTADRALLPVAVPRPPRGGSVGFSFDGERRGWVASLPESQQLPTVAYGGDKVYVSGGFQSVSFYALHATTGQMQWATTNLEDNGPTSAVFEDGRVIFNTESCTLFALDARTGKRLWLRWLGDPTLAQTAVADGLVFAAHPAEKGYVLSALRVTTGAPVWSGWIGSEAIAAPVIAGDSVYVSTLEGLTLRFVRKTGRLRWSRRLGATTAPWISGDELFVTRRRGKQEQQIVVATGTGEIVREHHVSAGAYAGDLPHGSDWYGVWAYEGSRPVVDRGVRYVAMGSEIHATDARTGEALWHRRYPGNADRRALGSVAVAGSAVVFATRDGKLFGLDVDTGYTLWSYDLGVRVVAQPIIARGWIYASTADGRVVALEVADPSLDGWHMFGGNPHHNGLVAPPPPPRPLEAPAPTAPAPPAEPAPPARTADPAQPARAARG
ncbi:MAG TPA: PQQ-binding-like beta-propeller repeat protein [Kofleriaceae bacterium]|nr:PQQ-binding-like beta-propeller repeat protein [Kofleriaceae bacterium]